MGQLVKVCHRASWGMLYQAAAPSFISQTEYVPAFPGLGRWPRGESGRSQDLREMVLSAEHDTEDVRHGAGGAEQSSSVPGISLCTSEATPGKKHTSGPCILSFPSHPC